MSKNHLSYQNGFTHSPLSLVMPPFNIVMHFTIRFVLKEHGFGHILPQGREFYGNWASWLYRLGSGYVFGITYTYSLSFKNPHWKYHLSILLLLPCFTTMPASFNAPPPPPFHKDLNPLMLLFFCPSSFSCPFCPYTD